MGWRRDEEWVAAASTWCPADPEPSLLVRADCGVRGCAGVAHRVRRGGSLTRERWGSRRTPCVFWFNTGAPATRVVARSGRRGAGAPPPCVELTVLRHARLVASEKAEAVGCTPDWLGAEKLRRSAAHRTGWAKTGVTGCAETRFDLPRAARGVSRRAVVLLPHPRGALQTLSLG